MRLIVTLLVLIMAGVALGACGGGGDKKPATDQEAIEQLFKDYAKAFDKLDEAKLITFYSSDCTFLEERVHIAVLEWEPFHDTVDFKIDGVQIQNLTADTAEAMPTGKTIYPGQEGAITVQTFKQLVKQNGEWKFVDCDFTF